MKKIKVKNPKYATTLVSFDCPKCNGQQTTYRVEVDLFKCYKCKTLLYDFEIEVNGNATLQQEDNQTNEL